MLSNHEGFHEYSGPTYSRTLSLTRDLEMTKPLLNKSNISQQSNRNTNILIEEQFQINGFKNSVVTEQKNDIIPVPLAKPLRKTTQRELILILLSIFIFIILLIVAIIMVKCLVVQDNSTDTAFESRNFYCLTTSCLRATSEITNVMGNSINQISLACNDLEKFACGDWIENSRLPPTSVNWNLLEELRYSHQEKLRNVLESDLGDLQENDYRWKFQTVFEKCLNRDIQSYGPSCGKNAQFESGIQELLEMPYLKTDSLDQILQHTQIYLNIPIFFATSIVRNYSQHRNETNLKNAILLSDYEAEGMPNHEKLNDNKEIEHLKEYITDCAKVAQFPESQIDILSEDFISVLRSIRFASYNANKEMRKFSELKTVTINLTELTVLTKQAIDFTRYLTIFHNKKHSSPIHSSVLLSNTEYFKQISTIVLQSKLSKLKNFIRFSIIHKYGRYVSQQLSNAKQKFLWRNTGRQHSFETWQDCIELFNSPGLAGLHQMSMRKNSDRNKMVERIEGSIMIHIKNSISKIVQLLKINQLEKRFILEKITNMKLLVQNLQISYLNDYFKNWVFNKNTSLLKIMQTFPSTHELPFSEENLLMAASNGISTYTDLSEYVYEKNSIVLSNIVLQWPFYSSDNNIPRYLEFASLGLWLAESISELFSYKASHFSKVGEKLKYPLNITFETLSGENLMKPFLNNKYFNGDQNLLTPLQVKAILTILIIEQAYDSFQKEVDAKEHVLPNLNYSAMQIMFIRLAQNFCSKIRPEYQMQMNQIGELTGPDKLKILMLLRSYRDIYKCDSEKPEENTK